MLSSHHPVIQDECCLLQIAAREGKSFGNKDRKKTKKKKIKREGQTINRNFQQHFPEDYTVFIFAATPGGTKKSFFKAALPSTERSEMKKKVLSNSQFILTS